MGEHKVERAAPKGRVFLNQGRRVARNALLARAVVPADGTAWNRAKLRKLRAVMRRANNKKLFNERRRTAQLLARGVRAAQKAERMRLREERAVNESLALKARIRVFGGV